MAQRVEILWQSEGLQSSEQCSIRSEPGPRAIAGVATLSLGDAPLRIEYAVTTDSQWATLAVGITLTGEESGRRLSLQRGGDTWTVDGQPRRDLDRCRDVDLGWTPATNVLPLRRLPIADGESMTTRAAWVRFPELDVVVSEQTYTRLAPDRVRYQSGTFEADLRVTPDEIVTTYGDELWVAKTLVRF